MQTFLEHIAIIMDGNRRWAKKRLLPTLAGHKAGAKALKKLVEELNQKDLIKCLTVYAFSTENWKREKHEIDYLMSIMREYIDDYLNDKKDKNTRLSVIGERTRLPKDLQDKISYIENNTKDNTKLHLVVALNYGARDEMLRAFKRLNAQITKANINPNDIDEDYFARFLDTKEIKDPDLLIRTSGEKRISNFLLWQSAYSELYFTDRLWPDFTIADLEEAIKEYNSRKRRMGQ